MVGDNQCVKFGASFIDGEMCFFSLVLFESSSADADTRHRFLLERNQRGVDFRASCFCHKKPLDAGFVCSVCLSVYCDERGACQTCDADFEA